MAAWGKGLVDYMQLNRFDLNLLIALDALLHEKNVTRAAERVFLSQPAMSASLQKLRDFFQDPLLVRVGREMELTPRARSLQQPVREALLKVQATLGTQPTFDAATMRRTFTVIATDEAVPELIPRVLGRLAREAPQIQCHVEQVSQTSLTRLAYGDADLCLSLDITRLYGLREFPETLQSVPLRPVRWVCVMSQEMAIPGETMTLADYQSLPHIFARPNGHTAPVEELVRRLTGMDLNVRATTQSLLEMLFMLPGSPFAATVPERVARLVLPLVPLKIFALPFEALDGHEILLWHPRNDLDPGHTWLRSLFIDVARDLQA
ncbi:MAG TPA: LysR family transcriptional regulator [Steroidobacteraceae bacterium]|jgi:LysR family nod box-dependent transcriptional activator|nr:LysR family transcriptional regulator [Steroidobacteraceae bacterium]